MSNVRWSIDGPDEEGLEVEGRRFSTNDEGVPMMCSLVCKSLGRHVHIDYCRAETPAECRMNNEVEHITKKLQPEPDKPKDFLTHNLFWKRSGKSCITHPLQCLTFRQDLRIHIRTKIRCTLQNGRTSYIVPLCLMLTLIFQVILCVVVGCHDDFLALVMISSGSEHAASGGKPATPSFCVLPLFHTKLSASRAQPSQGHVSGDGHQFVCKNPATVRQSFHMWVLVMRLPSLELTSSHLQYLFDWQVSNCIHQQSGRRGDKLPEVNVDEQEG